MKRIIVGMNEARRKLYAAPSFFRHMGFGCDPTDSIMIYYRDYYFTKEEGNLFKRHMKVLRSVQIKFTVEESNEEENNGI